MKKIILPLIILFIGISSCKQNTNLTLKPFFNGEKWGFIDDDKHIILDAKYDDVMSFSEGFAAIKRNGKWGFINQNGDEVVNPVKYEKVSSFSEKRAMVSLNNLYGFIDENGDEIVAPEKYNYVGSFSNGFAPIRTNNMYGFINRDGEEVISPKYEMVWNFSENMAKVYQNNRFGYINKQGEEIIPIKYNYISKFYNGKALVNQNDVWKFISKNGTESPALDYDYVWEADSKGYYKVFKNDKYGYINNDAKEIILLKYEYTSNFRNNISVVKNNSLYGIINRKGDEIIPIKYINIDQLKEVYLKLTDTKGKISIKDIRGNESIKEPQKVTTTVKKSSGKFTDTRDSNVYTWEKIGNQIWMTENLRYKTKGSKCYPKDCEKYGQYYTWATAQNVCPEGWRLPTIEDWQELINNYGNSSDAFTGLTSDKENSMNLLFGGYIYNSYSFETVGDYGYYWTSTKNMPEDATCIWINKYEKNILQFTSATNHLRNIRCIKENN